MDEDGALTDPDSQAIADAVLRITARDGLHAVSIRTVAAEAGRSVGMVQRRFGSKDHLLRCAMRRVVELVASRIRGRLEALGPEPDPREFVEELSVELITAGPVHHDEGMIWLAFLARAVVVPELAEELREQYRPGEAAIANALRDAGAADIDPDLEATALIAMLDGLTAHVLLGRIERATAVRALRAQLDRLLPGR